MTPPDPALARKRGVTADYVFVEPSASQLQTLADLCDRGKLKPSVQRIFPLADAAEAQTLSQAGHVRGKLVLAL